MASLRSYQCIHTHTRIGGQNACILHTHSRKVHTCATVIKMPIARQFVWIKMLIFACAFNIYFFFLVRFSNCFIDECACMQECVTMRVYLLACTDLNFVVKSILFRLLLLLLLLLPFFFCLILFPRLHRARSPSLTKFRHSQAHRNIGKLHAHETGTNEC